jgi:hypothetical protein
MSLRSALLAGIVAAAACGGCATSTRPVATSADWWAVEGYASPPMWNVRDAYRPEGCSGGTYNRAAWLCVSEGV